LISFEFKFLDPFVNKTDLTQPQNGVYIDGLFIEGAQWDK